MSQKELMRAKSFRIASIYSFAFFPASVVLDRLQIQAPFESSKLNQLLNEL